MNKYFFCFVLSDNIIMIILCECFPILYKTTQKFPIQGVVSCSQNAKKKHWLSTVLVQPRKTGNHPDITE